jgi:hypothetical protein
MEIEVPSNRPILDQLKFDQDGNLWVIHTRVPREPYRADVFGPNGDFLAVVTWPGGVNVSDGFVSLRLIGGVLTDRLGVESVGIVALDTARAP